MVVASNGSGHLRLGAGGSEKVRITATGLVGINSTSPRERLDVIGNANIIVGNSKGIKLGYRGEAKTAYIGIDSNDAPNAASQSWANSSYIGFYSDGSSERSITYRTNAGSHIFQGTNGNEYARINNNGLVGIGTDNPEDELHVFLNSSSDGPSLRFTNPNGGDGTFIGRISTGDAAGTFFAGINFLKHDSNDGEIRLRTKVAGSNTDVVTIVDGNVGVGLVNPTQKLTIAGNTQVENATFKVVAASPNIILSVPGGGIDSRIYNDGSGNFNIGHGANSDTPPAKLSITTAGELVSTNGTLRRDVSTSSFTVSGDTASNTGANINLYGASHSSLANVFRVRTGSTERFRITSAGNVGINKTPKEWYNTYRTIQIYDGGYIAGSSDDSFVAIGANNYLDTGGTYDYTNTDYASQLYQVDGQLVFRNAPSGTADTAITWAERFKVTSDGKIGVGAVNPRYSLEVYDSNLLVSGSSAGNLILEDRGVADSSRPFTVLNNDGGYFNINRSNRNASGTTTSSALAFRIDPDGKVRIGSSGGDVSVLNVHAETDGNLHVRPIADVTGTTPGGSGVVFDVLNDASNTVKDIAFRGATTIFRNASTETLRITSDGYVSIGENTPSSITRRLYVAGDEATAYSSSDGSNNAYLRLINKNGTDNTGVNNHVGIEMYVATGATSVGMLSMVRTGNNTGDFTYKTRTGASTYAEHFRIASNGKVGINTDNPKQKLSVVGRANFDHNGDYYGAWIDGDSSGTSSFNVGVWYNTGGKFRNDGNNVVIETMNESHDIGIQPGANEGKSRVGVGIHGPGAKLHVRDTANAAGVTGTDILRIANLRVNTDSGSANLRFVTNEVSGTNQYTRAQIGAEYDGSSNVNGRLNFATTDSSGNLNEWARLNSVGKLLVVKGTYGFSNAYSKSNVNGHLEAGDFRISHPSDGFALTCGSYGRSNTLNAYAGLGLATEYPKIGLFAVS